MKQVVRTMTAQQAAALLQRIGARLVKTDGSSKRYEAKNTVVVVTPLSATQVRIVALGGDCGC